MVTVGFHRQRCNWVVVLLLGAVLITVRSFFSSLSLTCFCTFQSGNPIAVQPVQRSSGPVVHRKACRLMGSAGFTLLPVMFHNYEFLSFGIRQWAKHTNGWIPSTVLLHTTLESLGGKGQGLKAFKRLNGGQGSWILFLFHFLLFIFSGGNAWQ